MPWRAVDPALHEPLRQTLGVVKGAPAAAARLAEWLLSAPGQALVARFGYAPARPALVERAR
jgi:ABC-type Fe3+ transport system substrate-binding protein